MKITNKQLKRIIKEETEKLLMEQSARREWQTMTKQELGDALKGINTKQTVQKLLKNPIFANALNLNRRFPKEDWILDFEEPLVVTGERPVDPPVIDMLKQALEMQKTRDEFANQPVAYTEEEAAAAAPKQLTYHDPYGVGETPFEFEGTGYEDPKRQQSVPSEEYEDPTPYTRPWSQLAAEDLPKYGKATRLMMLAEPGGSATVIPTDPKLVSSEPAPGQSPTGEVRGELMKKRRARTADKLARYSMQESTDWPAWFKEALLR